MAIGRAVGRLSSLLTVVLLARILPAESFGLLAVATLSASLAEVATQTGVREYLIHKPSNVAGLVPTAMTLEIVRGVLIAALLYLAAGPVAGFFAVPEARSVVRWMALAPLLRSLVNVCLSIHIRSVDFRGQFAVDCAGPISGLGVAVAVALIYENVWALVAGQIVSAAMQVVVSFLVAPLPGIGFRLHRARLFLPFGVHLFWGGITTYLAMQSAVLLTGRLFDASVLGLFTVAFTLACTPPNQIAKPIAKVVFAALSRMDGEPARLLHALTRSYTLILALTAPLCAGVALLAEDVRIVVLGDSWEGIEPVLRILALGALVRTLSTAGAGLFWSVGRPDVPAILGLVAAVTCALLVGLVSMLVGRDGLAPWHVGAAWSFSYLVHFGAWLWFAYRSTGFGLRMWVASQWQTVLALGALTLCVALALIALSPGPVRLFAAVIVGAAGYAAALWMFDRVGGGGAFTVLSEQMRGRRRLQTDGRLDRRGAR